MASMSRASSSIRAAIHGRDFKRGRAARKMPRKSDFKKFTEIHGRTEFREVHDVNYLSEMYDHGLQWVKMDLRI